ncbi:MAG: hypothetical protein ACXADW_23365 [Candidatus Hodarchaeales archaeon]|jgi:hypothetical protein
MFGYRMEIKKDNRFVEWYRDYIETPVYWVLFSSAIVVGASAVAVLLSMWVIYVLKPIFAWLGIE